MLYGPDGHLYVMLGDGGSAGDPGGRGQSLTDLLGSILRIDPHDGGGYTVPADNPFVGTAGALPEIWSYGLRNPWRVAFDPANGDLYIADVGQRRVGRGERRHRRRRRGARSQLRLEGHGRPRLLRGLLLRSG